MGYGCTLDFSPQKGSTPADEEAEMIFEGSNEELKRSCYPWSEQMDQGTQGFRTTAKPTHRDEAAKNGAQTEEGQLPIYCFLP